MQGVDMIRHDDTEPPRAITSSATSHQVAPPPDQPIRAHALPVVDVDILVLTIQAYDNGIWRLPISAIATAVDLRPRRAQRLPNPMSFGRAVQVARLDTGTHRSFFDQATVALVFRSPRRVPSGPWDADPMSPGPPPAHGWDAVVISAGKQTDNILATLARRGVPRSPSIAAGVLAAARKAPGGDPFRAGLRMTHGGDEQRLIMASICLVVATALALALVVTTSSPTWLVILLAAIPTYLMIASQTGAIRSPSRRLPQ
jgi:hypothetical protein